uniref:Uncharacterized protein n=1 Tax=Saffron-associated alphaflexivirus TaxID=3125858 RepID=A0AAU6NEJ6_9VIRU
MRTSLISLDLLSVKSTIMSLTSLAAFTSWDQLPPVPEAEFVQLESLTVEEIFMPRIIFAPMCWEGDVFWFYPSTTYPFNDRMVLARSAQRNGTARALILINRNKTLEYLPLDNGYSAAGTYNRQSALPRDFRVSRLSLSAYLSAPVALEGTSILIQTLDQENRNLRARVEQLQNQLNIGNGLPPQPHIRTRPPAPTTFAAIAAPFMRVRLNDQMFVLRATFEPRPGATDLLLHITYKPDGPVDQIGYRVLQASNALTSATFTSTFSHINLPRDVLRSIVIEEPRLLFLKSDID